MSVQRRLLDFHSHYYDPTWFSSLPTNGPSVVQRAWPLLTNIEAQLEAMNDAGIDGKVVSAPASVIVPSGEALPVDLMQRINDRLAELVTAYPEQLLAVATIDAFQGDVAAREVERAVQSLGLRGICIDCSQRSRYIDVPEVRPTLQRAAELDIPVFVHPVSPPGLTERLAFLGHSGTLLARGTEDAASVLALLRSGVLDGLPRLKIVIPMIGAAALMFAGIAEQEYGREEGWHGMSPSVTRKRLYIDTMGFDVASIRFAIGLLGSDHVLLGSDWPIMPIAPRKKVEEMLAALAPLALTEGQKLDILAGNTLRLLHVTMK